MYDLVEVGTAITTAASASLAVTVPAGMTIPAGSTLIAVITKNTTGVEGGATPMVDSRSNVWDGITNPSFNSTSERMALYRASHLGTALQPGDTITYTPTATSSIAMQVFWLTGRPLGGIGSYDVAGSRSNAASASTMLGPTLSPTKGGPQLWIAGYGMATASALTVSSIVDPDSQKGITSVLRPTVSGSIVVMQACTWGIRLAQGTGAANQTTSITMSGSAGYASVGIVLPLGPVPASQNLPLAYVRRNH